MVWRVMSLFRTAASRVMLWLLPPTLKLVVGFLLSLLSWLSSSGLLMRGGCLGPSCYVRRKAAGSAGSTTVMASGRLGFQLILFSDSSNRLKGVWLTTVLAGDLISPVDDFQGPQVDA